MRFLVSLIVLVTGTSQAYPNKNLFAARDFPDPSHFSAQALDLRKASAQFLPDLSKVVSSRSLVFRGLGMLVLNRSLMAQADSLQFLSDRSSVQRAATVIEVQLTIALIYLVLVFSFSVKESVSVIKQTVSLFITLLAAYLMWQFSVNDKNFQLLKTISLFLSGVFLEYTQIPWIFYISGASTAVLAIHELREFKGVTNVDKHFRAFGKIIFLSVGGLTNPMVFLVNFVGIVYMPNGFTLIPLTFFFLGIINLVFKILIKPWLPQFIPQTVEGADPEKAVSLNVSFSRKEGFGIRVRRWEEELYWLRIAGLFSPIPVLVFKRQGWRPLSQRLQESSLREVFFGARRMATSSPASLRGAA